MNELGQTNDSDLLDYIQVNGEITRSAAHVRDAGGRGEVGRETGSERAQDIQQAIKPRDSRNELIKQ